MTDSPSAGGDGVRALLALPPVVALTPRGAIEYVDHGQGPVVLALHGGMGGYDQGLILARAVLSDLDRFRVLAVSRPGYLGTPLAAGETPEAQADLYAALLDRLGIGRALVVAVSAGGVSALRFALRHPDRCAGLVLVSTATGRLPIPAEVASRLPVMKLLARLPWLTALMRRRAERNPAASARRSILDEAVVTRTLEHPEAGPLLRALQSSALDRLGRRLPGTLNDMAQLEDIETLPVDRISAPVLVVHGDGDRIVPFDHARRVAEGAPRAALMTVEGGEHVAVFTHLDAVRARVAVFVAGLDLA